MALATLLLLNIEEIWQAVYYQKNQQSELMHNQYYYQIYGLKLSSNLPLPGLVTVNNSVSVDIDVQLVGKPKTSEALLNNTFWNLSPESEEKDGFHLWTMQKDDGVYHRIRYYDGTDAIDFIFNPQNNKIWAFWSKDEQFETAVSWLIGSSIGYLLRLRGITCLHSSVVAIDGGAVAFLGYSTAGKSTTAAALTKRGFVALADDIAVIVPGDAGFLVMPGESRLRLLPSSVNAFEGLPASLARVSIYHDKCFVDLRRENQQFTPQPLPLRAVYILGDRDPNLTTPLVKSLTLTEAMKELIQNSYWSSALSMEQRSQEFQELATLARTVSVKQLLRPDGLGCLEQICNVILEDLEISKRFVY